MRQVSNTWVAWSHQSRRLRRDIASGSNPLWGLGTRQSRQSAGLLPPKVLKSCKCFNLGRMINKISDRNEVLLACSYRLLQIQTNHSSETSHLVRTNVCPMQRSLILKVHKHPQIHRANFWRAEERKHLTSAETCPPLRPAKK